MLLGQVFDAILHITRSNKDDDAVADILRLCELFVGKSATGATVSVCTIIGFQHPYRSEATVDTWHKMVWDELRMFHAATESPGESSPEYYQQYFKDLDAVLRAFMGKMFRWKVKMSVIQSVIESITENFPLSFRHKVRFVL